MPETVSTSYLAWRSITDVVDGYFPIFFATVVVLFLIAVLWMTSKAASKGTLKKKNVDGLSMEEIRPLGPAYVWAFSIVIFTAIVALAYPLLSSTLCENYTCKSSVWFRDWPDLFSECRPVPALPE